MIERNSEFAQPLGHVGVNFFGIAGCAAIDQHRATYRSAAWPARGINRDDKRAFTLALAEGVNFKIPSHGR